MKKIFKLFLCLLMLISFTNITRALGEEEGEFVDARVVAQNFVNTNFIQALLIQARKENPNSNIEASVDEENHEINLISDGEIFLTFNYTDEVIALYGQAPETEEDIDIGLYMGQMIYTQNMLYALLDTMGYSDMDVQIGSEEDEEEIELNEEFFSEYGILMTTGEFSFEQEAEECTEESEECESGGTISGTYLSEARLSLSREKIAKLVKDFGVRREDFLALVNTDVVKPEVTIKKKGSALVLSWDEDDNAVKFEVYRSEKKDGKYKKIATVKTNSYKDKKVSYGKKYYYKVKAIGEENKATSDIKSFKVAPAKVNGVKLSAIKTNSIKVSYEKQDETGYVIERSTDQKKWKTVKTITKAKTLSFTDKGLSANKKYYYRVKAYKAVGRKRVYGAYSEVVSVKTAPAKTKISVKANTWNSLKLSITASKGATKYKIYRSDKKSGTYTFVNETSETSFVDVDLSYGKTYFYKVKACNNDNKCSDYSAVVSAKVGLKKPGLSLETGKTVQMTLVVTGISEVDGYEVYRSTDNKKFTLLKDVEGNPKKYVDETAKKNKTYYYKVRSYKEVGGKKKFSSYSDTKKMKNLYEAPASQVFVTANPSELNGGYGNGDNVLRIYAITDEKIAVNLDRNGMGASFPTTLADGKLVNSEEGVTISFTQEKNELYATVTGFGDPALNGKYHRTAPIDLDDFHNIFMGQDEFLETKYNGKFVDGDNVLYMYQAEEGTAYIKGTVNGFEINTYIEVRGNEGLRVDLGSNSYSGDVVEGVLTLQLIEDTVPKFNESLTKESNLTKQQIAEIFFE